MVEVYHMARDNMRLEREGPMGAKKRPRRRQQPKSSTTSRVPQPLTADALVYAEYDITDEPLDNRDIKRLPSQVQARIDDLYELAQHDPMQAIPELERLIATYPQVPTFYNYLSIAYLQRGNLEKTDACVREAYRRHPQYLFAKVNYANLCLQQLYPHRKRFHVSEVMCRYFCAIGEQNTAILYYQMLKQVMPNHPMTKQAKRALYPPFWVRWLRTWADKNLPEQANTRQRSDAR